MPSTTDLLHQSTTSKISSHNHEKSTPPSQQPISSTLTGNTNDTMNVDPITQVILMLEKKQRNLGKRKEKLESYEEEAKTGKELNKDQKEALAKYSEVLGQIECVKDISEQIKKIQAESAKNQKRLLKQATEEKRLQITQRLREYAQFRYLLDHRPPSLKPEESSLLDELARIIVPCDISLNTITRSVDAVLSIYQGGSLSSAIKNITGRTSQELREILEQLIKQYEVSPSIDTSTIQEIKVSELVKQPSLVIESSSTTSITVLSQDEQDEQKQSNNNILESSLNNTHLIQTSSNEYPLQFDTRNQNIPLQKIIEDSTFFSIDSITSNVEQDSLNSQESSEIQKHHHSNQMVQTLTIINSNLNDQTSSQGYKETRLNCINSNSISTDESVTDGQWQHPRTNSGQGYRGGQFNGNSNKNYHRGGQHNYNQQHWQGSPGGHYDVSYNSGQRYFNENTNRSGVGHRGGANSNYRGNRSGNYRGGGGGSRNGNGNGNQQSAEYPQNIE